jgi:serine phosphatase RsbU (regulator of sigma subunit)
MAEKLLSIARVFWPELETMIRPRRLVGMGDVITFLAMAPLAAIGLLWLALETDLSLILREWPAIALIGGLIVLFSRVNYFIIVEIRSDRYGSADGSLASMIQWAGVFLFGATALWLSAIWTSLVAIWGAINAGSTAARWSQARHLAQELAVITISQLTAIQVYLALGGRFPLSEMTVRAIIPALAALATQVIVITLLWLVYVIYSLWVQQELTKPSRSAPLIYFMILALGLPILSHPFAILAAGMYTQHGVLVFLFFITGLLLVAYLGRQLSWAAETSRQQSRLLEKLEHLGRDIINSPPDASTLPELLRQHVPSMFPSARVLVWMNNSQALVHLPSDWSVNVEPIWGWMQEHPEACSFMAKEPLPWGGLAGGHDPVVAAPIMDAESPEAIGFIYLELRSLSQPWDRRALTSLFPGAYSLADQVASALHQSEIYQETLAAQQTQQELEFAGRIQASFLPNELPRMDGWELAVTLLPARETSGDFFDFIPLPEGKIGILIADVADKGLGSALYMALSRTLIRTYALEYVDSQPDIVFFSTNERILSDARANLFVTAFYGVLDQETNTLTYCNAGHNPPYLISSHDGGSAHPLGATGMPIGIEEDAYWGLGEVRIEPGDVLLLYTDGIPDAQNEAGEFYKADRLVEVARSCAGHSAQEVQNAVLDSIQKFVGDASQFDDITLLVLMRYD